FGYTATGSSAASTPQGLLAGMRQDIGTCASQATLQRFEQVRCNEHEGEQCNTLCGRQPVFCNTIRFQGRKQTRQPASIQGYGSPSCTTGARISGVASGCWHACASCFPARTSSRCSTSCPKRSSGSIFRASGSKPRSRTACPW